MVTSKSRGLLFWDLLCPSINTLIFNFTLLGSSFLSPSATAATRLPLRSSLPSSLSPLNLWSRGVLFGSPFRDFLVQSSPIEIPVCVERVISTQGLHSKAGTISTLSKLERMALFIQLSVKLGLVVLQSTINRQLAGFHVITL